jgi:hypothetical protein
MAHFAKIENGFVTSVIVVNNEILLDEDGVEQESIGATFCAETFGGEWVQTSYNANFRSKYASPGDKWDGTNFVSPKKIVENA